MKTFCVAPVLHVSNLGNALKFYLETLGFTEDFKFNDYAGIKFGEVALHLCGHNMQELPIGGGACYIFCDEVDAYYQEIARKGAKMRTTSQDWPYGMRDFTVIDPDGNRITFGCEIAKS